MDEREDMFRRYGTDVVDLLRRWLVEEGLEKPLGDSGYRIRTEDVALERRGDEWTAVIRFRIAGDDRRHGFLTSVAEASDPQKPWREPPDATAEIILIILDEAILTSKRRKPDDERIVWLR